MAMFGYMTNLETVEAQKTEEIVAEGNASGQDFLCLYRHLIVCTEQ